MFIQMFNFELCSTKLIKIQLYLSSPSVQSQSHTSIFTVCGPNDNSLLLTM